MGKKEKTLHNYVVWVEERFIILTYQVLIISSSIGVTDINTRVKTLGQKQTIIINIFHLKKNSDERAV